MVTFFEWKGAAGRNGKVVFAFPKDECIALVNLYFRSIVENSSIVLCFLLGGFVHEFLLMILRYVKIYFQDVLYDPKTKQIYTPNTNQTAQMGTSTIPLQGPAEGAKLESRGDFIQDPETGRMMGSESAGGNGGGNGGESTENKYYKIPYYVPDSAEEAIKNASKHGKTLYDSAKDGGPHAGAYRDALNMEQDSLRRAITSHCNTVKEHQIKIDNPEKCFPLWKDKGEKGQAGIIKKWKKDMRRNAEQAEIKELVYKERFGENE